MSNLDAKRRYFRIFLPAMAVFLGASALIAALEDSIDLPLVLYGLAVVPIVAQLALFLAHLRFINEVDEFLRSIQIQAVLFGLAVVLCIATGWGYLEAYADVPRLHILWLNPIYWVSYAIAAMTLTWRATGRIE